MYKIEKTDGYLLVRFQSDFDCSTIQSVIHQLSDLREYPYTNDIWLIGGHHADIRLGELDTLMRAFQCQCAPYTTRSKTAIVVDAGFTETLIAIWANASRRRVPFDVRLFDSVAEAEVWVGDTEEAMAG